MYEDYCEFCEILRKNRKESCKTVDAILYENQQYFAFHDINKATAVEHVLVCTKEHIETATDIQDPQKLIKIKNVGYKVLDMVSDKNVQARDYRFGFHLKPFNTINHVHLHCFILPFKSFLNDKITYGWMLTSVQTLIERIKSSQKPQTKL